MSRMVLAVVIVASSCLATACAGDMSPVAPSSTSMSSSNDVVSTISGRVTGRETHSGISGARVTVQAGSMKGANTVTDSSGFYTVPIKGGQVMVSVKADNYIDRSETLYLVKDTTHLDFQLMAVRPE